MNAPPLPANMAEIVANAHDRLHKSQVEEAHELLHKALGVDNDAAQELGIFTDKRNFDHAFRTACKKNLTRAAYVVVEQEDPKNKRVRIVTGGDVDVCRLVEQLINDGMKANKPQVIVTP